MEGGVEEGVEGGVEDGVEGGVEGREWSSMSGSVQQELWEFLQLVKDLPQ